LPARARAYIYRRIGEELRGGGRLELETVYPEAARLAALEILAATKPESVAGSLPTRDAAGNGE